MALRKELGSDLRVLARSPRASRLRHFQDTGSCTVAGLHGGADYRMPGSHLVQQLVGGRQTRQDERL